MNQAWTVACLALASACASSSVDPDVADRAAWLGVETSTPSSKLRAELELPFDVRVQGRVVESVAPDGPAAAAGIVPGDVLLTLGGGELYSRDDVSDFERVHRPGDVAAVTLRRRGSAGALEARIELGATAPAPDAERPGALAWRYSNLAGLDDALDRARAERKRLLVGLSGAET